jgi:hypothetical protein
MKRLETGFKTKRISIQQGLILAVVGAAALLLVLLILSTSTWTAIAYTMVALLALLIFLSVYFWGTIIFGGLIDLLQRRSSSSPWSVGSTGNIPEHDIDPGLELVSAGMLVYRYGEVKPRIHFRKVPLTGARAIRPFVVARTGSERQYNFHFMLNDDNEKTRYSDEFSFNVKNEPQLIMPHYRLSLSMPKKLVGQRWNLRVRSGVTTVTSFRFMFIEEGSQTELLTQAANAEPILASQEEMLARLLDTAIKQDVLGSTQEIELETI